MIEWQSFGDGWRRWSDIEPGYDCRVECKHERKGDHGICADGWFYVVSDGECAISLHVRSADYPATVETSRFLDFTREPYGTDLSLHVPWPIAYDLESSTERIRLGETTGRMCDVVEGGRCWTPKSTSLGADEFWKLHGSPAQFDQPESFWTALCEKAKEWIAEVQALRAQLAHVRQCSHCRGRGVIEAAEGTRVRVSCEG